MSSTHIEIVSTASRLSADVRSAIDAARQLQERIVKAVDIMDQVASGGDWDALATKLGTDAANAELAYNLVVGMGGDVGSATFNSGIDRLG